MLLDVRILALSEKYKNFMLLRLFYNYTYTIFSLVPLNDDNIRINLNFQCKNPI